MKVVMLGTGAADGWPTPFCWCASCAQAAAAGHIRRQTSALIDDIILLDCGAEAPRSAVQSGRRLDRVRLILFTHAHPDHCDPQAVLWRRWASIRERLVIAGPPDALERCEQWIGPDDPIDFEPLSAGSTLDVVGYSVTAVAATHTPGALLYAITAPDGSSLLYATDTGPLTDDTVAALGGRRFDAAFVELTWGDVLDHGTAHLDLATFPDTLRRLRDVEAITDETDVVAIHLGHRNPPEPELSRRLASWGARAVLDHDEVVVSQRVESPCGETTTASISDAVRAVQPRRTLILGGARSGKSVEAERRAAAASHVVYVATAVRGSRDGDTADTEWDERVALHQQRRPQHWTTVETIDVAELLRTAAPGSTLLIDCLTLWLSSQLDRLGVWTDDNSGEHPDAAEKFAPLLSDLIDALRHTQARVICVSNEVGSGIVPDSASGRLFRDLLGTVNASVASVSEEVLLVTAGRAVSL